MKTRIISLIVVAILALGIAATAQVAKSHARPNAKAGTKTESFGKCRKMAEELGLTTEQKQKIAEIVKGYFAEIKPILQSSITPQEKKAQIEPIRTNAVNSIMAVLTPDQQAKAKEMGLPEKMLRPMKNRAAGIERALSQLNLTEQQKTSIKSIFETSREKAKAIKEDTSLTQEQKKTQFMELKQATHEQVMSVLTPEQQQKLQDMIAKGKQGRQDGQTQNKRAASQKARVK